VARKLIVEIVGDASKLEKSYRQADQATKRFGQTTEKTATRMRSSMVAAAGATVSLAGLVAGLKGSISAASDLDEQMSKTGQVFGSSAADVQAWSKTTAASMGISRREALATASSFGALFQPMGLVGPKAAEQSQKLTQLGADLASFYNTDVSDALEAIRSGIVGESEPLRRYGVLLSETRVQAKALGDTHKQSARDLTAAEKAAARIAIIFRDTSKAQGDFARTSEGLANQSRTLKAELEDLQTNFGEPYLRGVTILAKKANEAAAALGLAGDPGTNVTLREQADLIPKLAREYGRLRDQGYSGADAIKQLRFELHAKGIKDDGMLIGDAINYFAGGASFTKITKLSQAIRGLGTDAETAAKSMHGLAAGTAAVAAATAAAAPRGLAALQPGGRAALGLAEAGLTPGTADNLAALRRQHQLNVRAAAFAQGRLSGATGPAAARWADNLRAVLERDSSTLDQIRGIQRDNAQKIKDAADKIKAANKAAADAIREAAKEARERKFGWLDFAIERAEATKTLKDDRAAYRALELALKERIRHEGRTLDLARQLWRARQHLRDLNKKQSDVDPLAGLMQVSSKRMANMLAAGTGLDLAGRRTLGANIAGLEMRPVYVAVHIDGREVGRAVAKDQARTSRRTSRQTSGYRG
jgi:hypothetical protein